MSKIKKLTRTWVRWAAEMEDKHGHPVAAGLAADVGFVGEPMTDTLIEKRTEYTLSLTADELTWLEQVMVTALRVYDKNPETGLAAELRVIRNQWRKKAYEQGWMPF